MGKGEPRKYLTFVLKCDMGNKFNNKQELTMLFKKSPTPTIDKAHTLSNAKWVLGGIYKQYRNSEYLVKISVEDNTRGTYIVKDGVTIYKPEQIEIFSFITHSEETAQSIANELIDLHNKGL